MNFPKIGFLRILHSPAQYPQSPLGCIVSRPFPTWQHQPCGRHPPPYCKTGLMPFLLSFHFGFTVSRLLPSALFRLSRTEGFSIASAYSRLACVREEINPSALYGCDPQQSKTFQLSETVLSPLSTDRDRLRPGFVIAGNARRHVLSAGPCWQEHKNPVIIKLLWTCCKHADPKRLSVVVLWPVRLPSPYAMFALWEMRCLLLVPGFSCSCA